MYTQHRRYVAQCFCLTTCDWYEQEITKSLTRVLHTCYVSTRCNCYIPAFAGGMLKVFYGRREGELVGSTSSPLSDRELVSSVQIAATTEITHTLPKNRSSRVTREKKKRKRKEKGKETACLELVIELCYEQAGCNENTKRSLSSWLNDCKVNRKKSCLEWASRKNSRKLIVSVALFCEELLLVFRHYVIVWWFHMTVTSQTLTRPPCDSIRDLIAPLSGKFEHDDSLHPLPLTAETDHSIITDK